MFDVSLKGTVIAEGIVDLVKEGIKTGVVQPLDRRTFIRNSAEEAFGCVEKGDRVGKVLLKMRGEETDERSLPKTLHLFAKTYTQFYFNKVYVIIGGLGGFGLKLTQWAIDRGARNIILTSRHGARTPHHRFCLKRWEEVGLNVRVSTLNAAERNEAEELLEEAMSIGPLGGIFNSAAVLKNVSMNAQTSEDYKTVCDPKSKATRILDELVRKLCPDVDHFVCFSSMVAGRGQEGISNYGYANSAMERICEERRKDGMKGLAIEWGIIGDVSVRHRHFGHENKIAGTKAQTAKSCLQAMDVFLQQEFPVAASYVAAEQTPACC